MKMKSNARRTRLIALLTALVLIAAALALPAFAMGKGAHKRHMGERRGFVGRTIDEMESGLGDVADDFADIPNGVDSSLPEGENNANGEATVPNQDSTDGNGINDDRNDNMNNDITDGTNDGMNDGTNDGMNDDAADGIPRDESLEDGTNIPDEDIGGAVADNDTDGISDAKDPDDDNDGIADQADTDRDGDGMVDKDETTGVIGIVIAVLVVIAIIILVIAVIPRAKRRS